MTQIFMAESARTQVFYMPTERLNRLVHT